MKKILIIISLSLIFLVGLTSSAKDNCFAGDEDLPRVFSIAQWANDLTENIHNI